MRIIEFLKKIPRMLADNMTAVQQVELDRMARRFEYEKAMLANIKRLAQEEENKQGNAK